MIPIYRPFYFITNLILISVTSESELQDSLKHRDKKHSRDYQAQSSLVSKTGTAKE